MVYSVGGLLPASNVSIKQGNLTDGGCASGVDVGTGDVYRLMTVAASSKSQDYVNWEDVDSW